MKTLVIHPDDRSTDFLKPIYENLSNITVVTGGLEWTPNKIIEAIYSHSQIIMMGHGYPGGLFGIGFGRTTVINQDCVKALSQKDNNIFIWCNADQFVARHGLKGFYTGMFISETGEAAYCGVKTFDQVSVDESNGVFARQLGECLGATRAPEEIYNQIKEQYGQLAANNLITEYNHQRLYFN